VKINVIHLDKAIILDEKEFLPMHAETNVRSGQSFQPYTAREISIVNTIEELQNESDIETHQNLWISITMLDPKSMRLNVVTQLPCFD
jgi:hypothetical protein